MWRLLKAHNDTERLLLPVPTWFSASQLLVRYTYFDNSIIEALTSPRKELLQHDLMRCHTVLMLMLSCMSLWPTKHIIGLNLKLVWKSGHFWAGWRALCFVVFLILDQLLLQHLSCFMHNIWFSLCQWDWQNTLLTHSVYITIHVL